MSVTNPTPYLNLASKFLRPDKRRAARVTVAQKVQEMLAFSIDASDADLWDRLRHEIPEWSHSGVVPQVTINRLDRCSKELDLQEARDPAQREEARNDLRSTLMGLYRVLISSDPITRDWREMRESWRNSLKPRWYLVGGGVLIFAVLVATWIVILTQ